MKNDMISRQAAIDVVDAVWSVTGDKNVAKVWDQIKDLPSAQPEPCEDTVNRQRLLSDLKELVAAWNKYPVMAEQIKGVEAAIGYVEAIPSAQSDVPDTNVGDTISRQAAIETVKKHYRVDNDLLEVIAYEIEALPSEQPGWVPVTERLPEKDGKYYVTQLRYGVYDSKMTGAYVRETNHIWYSVRHKRWSVMANCKVVAWIEELPKPWEGDVND